MAKRLVGALLAFVLAVGFVPLPAFAGETGESAAVSSLEPGTYVEHEAIAYVLDDGAGARSVSLDGGALAGAQTLMAVDAEAAVEALEDEAGSSAHAGARFSDGSPEGSAGRLVLVRDESKTTEELISALQADERVVFAEPNGYVEQVDAEKSDVVADGVDAGAATSDVAGGQTEPADGATEAEPALLGSDKDEPASDVTGFQWGMSNNGSMGGVSADEAIDIEYDAWNDASAVADLEDVVVAVIDSGVDETNPDLAGVLWDEGEDYPELTALGGDAHGISTVPDTTSTAPISSEQSHGTHVAGIIAAEWNDQGVSGVAPNVKIMSVRSDVDTASDMLCCINYVTEAAKAGVNVRVANCSWGMGSNATRAFDVAFTQMGQAGVTAVFASGNSDSDMDATLNTVSTLRDNPYIVVVDSIDATGALSMFSCYGTATTDVVAPGTTILSTWPTSDQQYLGEEDVDAALYESFDSETRVADSVLDEEGAQVASGAPALTFRFPESMGGHDAPIVEGGKRFDGDAALQLSYSLEEALALGTGYMGVQSSELDLSGLAEKPRYLSIRMISECANGEAGTASVNVTVSTTGGGQSDSLLPVSDFGFGGDSWSGYFVELPENTDFEHFCITIYYLNLQASVLGGQQQAMPADGTVYIDSIGLGSDLVPYKFSQGTSMAAPAVAGAAAVMAGAHTDDSAAQLAARVKGAAQGDAYAEWCSTGGSATVDGAASPSPVPTEAEASEDGETVTVRGYFVPDDVQVSIGDAVCAVLSRNDAAGGAGDGELTELAVQAPEGFAGGEAWVEIAGGNGSGRVLVQFEAIEQEGGAGSHATYYDETNLLVPSELDDWGGWQLVGFAGDVYALPQENEMSYNADHAFMMKYDPETREWSRVATPSSDQFAAAGVRNVASMAGATYQGSLIVQITSNACEESSEAYTSGSYWRYTAEGTWEHIPVPSLDGATLSMSALGSDGESLYVFGGKGSYGCSSGLGEEIGEVKAIFRVDLGAGTAEEVGEMIRERHNAQVAYRDGVFVVGSGQNTAAQEASSMGVERIRVLAEDEAEEYPAGSLVSDAVRMSSLVTETGELAFAPAAVADGFIIVGPRCDEGEGVADTYTLASEDGALPQTYGKLASDQRLLAPSALAYADKLYVLAATTSDPYRVFSATTVETVPQPGDYVASEPGPDPDPEPEPEPGEYPETFDLRDEGAVTSVKMQNPWGTSWAFSALASLESSVLKDGGSFEGDEPDYSERQLAWNGRTTVDEATDSAQVGEGSYSVRMDAGADLSESALVFNSGGDFSIAAATLAAWEGAANEEDVPYQNRDGVVDFYATSEEAGDWSIDEDQRNLSAVHVQDANIIPGTATFSDPEHPSTESYVFNEEALDTAKRLLMEEGAVGAFYYADASWLNQETGESDYMNYVTWAQYVYQYGTEDDSSTSVNENTSPNHSVTIVGWDDAYDRENFSSDPAKQPPADGAWIVKNGWGDASYGDDFAWGVDEDGDGLGDGYFYLSYYDMTVIQFASFRGDTPDASGAFDYDSNYQYDYLGIGSVCKVAPGSFGDASAANVFTTEGAETLSAVSAVTTEADSTIQVQVYLLDDDAQSPTDGTLVAEQVDVIELSGYHTIVLDQPVTLSAGQRFSVVESIDGAQGAYLPLEVAGHDSTDPDEAAGGFVLKKQQAAVTNAGESFYSTDGGATWIDASTLTKDDLEDRVSLTVFGGDPEVLGVGNAMIKAFTVDDGPAGGAPETSGAAGESSKKAPGRVVGLAKTGDSSPTALATLVLLALAAGGALYAVRRGKEGR